MRRLLILTLLALLEPGLTSCQGGQPVANENYNLAGRWTIEYEQSARSILEARGLPADPTRTNLARMQLKQKFYGEFQFREDGGYSLVYRVEGKEKKDTGNFTIREQKGARFLLAARSDAKESAGVEEVFTIEFLKGNLIRLQKEEEKDLPPLIFEREAAKP